VKVDPTDIVTNNPSEIVIVIPQLVPGGAYKLKITTQYGSGAMLKEPRSTIFDRILNVN
jgi:hypothetical protein